jgi:hypothetical protein
MCFEMLLYTGKFLLTCSTHQLWKPSVQTLPNSSSGLTTLPKLSVSANKQQTMEGYDHAESMV